MADTHKDLKCPACQKSMKKVFVPKEKINLDICIDGCGGIWFDNREIKHFDEQDENIDEIISAIDKKTFDKVDSKTTRSCPLCGSRMVKNFVSAKREIQIDECYACGGKFFDAGELQGMRDQYATEEERSADVLKLVYSTVGVELKKLDEEQAKLEAERSILKRLFDKIIFG